MNNRTNKDVTIVDCMSKKIYLWDFYEDIIILNNGSKA